ncbi:MAG: alpha/beta hydrolase [Bacteroidia bacterium]|nr:alpha/beta hydrolase [Bacteroidia bacterium]NNM23380.1 alpha/beta hydrolase [Flavobacteriaceae bacterium]
MKYVICLVLAISCQLLMAQKGSYSSRDISVSPFVDGTLLLPDGVENPPLAVIIAGSGPTDRNGNQQMMNTNSLKYLAQGLSEKGIATFRYDKRILKQMKERTLNEESISFDEFIKDAIDVVEYFKRANAFSEIHIIGHSQGSLVGMIAAQGRADGFVSLAGAGQSIDNLIVDQLAKQAPGLKDNARQAFDDMRSIGVAVNYSPGLSSIFRRQIQPFMITWMAYDPQVELAKLDIPVLIINGERDLQVQVSEAEKLKAALPSAQYLIVPKMNHILKEIEGDDVENSKSYNLPRLPVVPELIDTVGTFILK